MVDLCILDYHLNYDFTFKNRVNIVKFFSDHVKL